MNYLTVEDVLSFHEAIIAETGGAHGVREMGLLLSALEMPKASMFGELLHPTVFDQAAAYLFHVVCNHPFLDGNKRTGTVCALTFLDMNGIDLLYDQSHLEELVIDIAAEKADKQDIASFFRSHNDKR